MSSLGTRLARRLLSIRGLIPLVILALLLVLAGLLMWHGARSADRLLVNAMTDSVPRLAEMTEERARRLIAPGRALLRLLVHDPLLEAESLDARLARLPVLVEALAVHEMASAVYVGYETGDFLLVRPWDERLAEADEGLAGHSAAWLVQAVTHRPGEGRVGEWRLYDAGLELLVRVEPEDYRFEPRERPWYRQAAGGGVALTPPYPFFTTREVGVTLSRVAPSGQGVVGLDATVTDLGREMRELRLTPGTRLAIVSERDEVLAYPELERLLVGEGDALRLALLDELGEPALEAMARLPHGEEVQVVEVEGEAWYGGRLPFLAMGESDSWLLVAVPASEVLAESRALLRRQALMAVGLVLLVLPVGLWLGGRIARPLHALGERARALGAFDFTAPRGVPSRIVEVHQLDGAMSGMADNLRRIRDMMRTLATEPRLERMLQEILEGLLALTGSRHGGVYLAEEGRSGLALVAEAGVPGDHAALPPRLEAESEEGELAELQRRLQRQQRLAVPLRSRDGRRLGLLVLAEQKGSGRYWADFVEEISSAAALAIEMRRLIQAEERLLDAIVRMIAGAIDAKSPHTGGHCSRVPVLAEMLLERVAEAREGPFAAVSPDDKTRQAFHLAAWLHDCGKLTTPDEVMEKGTKLETRYNRIHEIRTRFEVLWRDAEIDYWRGIAAGEDADRLAEVRARRRQELREAFALVAAANLGAEAMDDATLTRLGAIAEWRWWRHFDDRLGVSAEEAERMAREPRASLPAEEPLLADRAWHRLDWPEGRRPPVSPGDPANRWGFAMALPPHAGHQGERYNLAVRRGTLNEIERFRIQEHVVQTLIMLTSLPWPAHLQRVPEIAGNHHERLDGAGYPRRLALSEASVEERVLAMADVLEALTASDRPYKSVMTLSHALAIVADMVRDGHLDGELFRLLLESGLWRDYAEAYLAPGQRDEVDIVALLDRAGLG